MSVRSATEVQTSSIRVPVAVVLGVTVAAATVLHVIVALQSPSPWIVPDELAYSELAKSLGDGGLPRVRGELAFVYGLGYPVLLAPIWALFGDVTTAYAVAKALNALILSATAIPAYFLARRFVTDWYALVVAVLTVAVPSMLYAGTLMTEVALYPAVVLALLAMSVALERPSLRFQAAALGAIALACTIKMLAGVLVAAYVGAILLYHWLEERSTTRWQTRMRAYAPTWLALATIAVAWCAFVFVSGRRPHDALGMYSGVLEHMDLAALPRWAVLHVAELDLSLAVIPFAATMIVAWRGIRRGADRSERLFVALAAPVLVGWFIAVGAFASIPFLEASEYPENVQRLQERSVFMLGPLFFIGLTIWLRDRRGRRATLAAVVIGAALLPALIPLDDLNGNVRFQALALVPWVALADSVAWPLGVMIFTFALGLAFALAVRVCASPALILAPVFLVFAVVGVSAHVSMWSASEWTRAAASGAVPDWVDAAVGRGTRVSVLWAEPAGRPFVDLEPRHRIVVVGEFFNRSLGDVYELGSSMPYSLPSTQVKLDDGRVVLEDGRPAPLGELVLAPCYVHVVGVPIARDASTGAVVFRVDGPVRASVDPPSSCTRTRSQ